MYQEKHMEGFYFLEDISQGKRYAKVRQTLEIDDKMQCESDIIRDVEVINGAEVTTDTAIEKIVLKDTGKTISAKKRSRQVGIKITSNINGDLVFVNSWTGRGIDKVMKALEKVIKYRAGKVYNITIYGDERQDVEQQLRLYAIDCVKRYDPTKGTAMLTFLTGHVIKQEYSLIKQAFSEKRAPTIHNVIQKRIYKCPECSEEVVVECDYQSKERKRIPERLACSTCGTGFDTPKIPIRKVGVFLNQKPVSLDKIISGFENEGMRTVSETVVGDDGSWADDILFDWDIKMAAKKLREKGKATEAMVLEMINEGLSKDDIRRRLGKMKYGGDENKYSTTGVENAFKRLRRNPLINAIFDKELANG
jgi:hypothetical protein